MWLLYIIISLTIIFILVCWYDMTHYGITRYNLHIDKPVSTSSKGFRFVLLTDLHSRHYGKNNECLINDIINQKPDFIVIAGDMLIGDKPLKNNRALDFICKLAEFAPVYYSYGNHESRQKENCQSLFSSYIDSLKKSGVIILANEYAIPNEYDFIRIYGLELPVYTYKRSCKTFSADNYLMKNFGMPDKSMFNMLLAHDPYYIKDYKKWGADLVLSGHLHGGLMRLPLLKGFISPRYELFPHYDCGIYNEGDCKLMVSRGLGNHSLPIRFLNIPEVIVVDISAE